MKFLILNADYAEFLYWLYAQQPGLESQPYEHQMRARNESLFGTADFYSSNLHKLGHEAWDIHVNNKFLQKAWADEHGLRLDSGQRWKFRLRKGIIPWVSLAANRPWLYEILTAQIKHYRPDVLFNQAMGGVSVDFLRGIRPYVKLLVGEHAATRLSETENWSVYDLVVSSFPPTLDWFRLKGVPAELNRLAFEPRVLSCLKVGERRIPISFVGSFYSVHSTRVEWLEYLCRVSQIKIWSPRTNHLPAASPILRSYVGSIWGVEMYQVLRDSVLTLNHHGDVPNYANNMRLFEATGIGTLLVTDWKKNLHEMFEPGKEVVCYRRREECAEMLQYYLEHDKEREEIAHAGQQRTLRDHTYYQRMQALVDLVERHLRQRSGPQRISYSAAKRVSLSG
jgi:spore maturation protein CgeB